MERYNCDYRQARMGTEGFRENWSEDIFLRLMKTKETAWLVRVAKKCPMFLAFDDCWVVDESVYCVVECYCRNAASDFPCGGGGGGKALKKILTPPSPPNILFYPRVCPTIFFSFTLFKFTIFFQKNICKWNGKIADSVFEMVHWIASV